MKEAATILVVGNTPQNVLLLEALLTSRGYKVITASSGHEALRLIGSASPDLVLLDVVMPGMSGYEVCQKIRARVRSLPGSSSSTTPCRRKRPSWPS